MSLGFDIQNLHMLCISCILWNITMHEYQLKSA